MADCDDRQLTEAQRQAGYQNQRTGVQQAVRPFSGRPTLDNLIDYINRELFPAVKRTRDKVNEVYLPVVDNAPSGNPLGYYFSTDTTNADPTAGRVRLDAATQDTATVIRVSESNGRLSNVAPWLDVMAGGATTPLGVVTLTDVINPTRFIRFDLNTMTDLGSYWNLAVTPIESSHDNPFVDGGAVVISFIPAVSSAGTTIPASALTPIAAESVLGNPTSSVAAPTAIALNDLSVLGRAGVLGTHVAGIDVPDTSTFTGESVFLRVASTRLAIQWRPWTLVDMPTIGNLKFVGNVSGATARPAYTDLAQLADDSQGIGFNTTTHVWKLTDIITDHFLGNITGATTTPVPTPLSSIDSTSLVYDGTTHTFQRAALTGDVTSAQDSNTVTVNANAVTNTQLRDSGPLSVIGRAANSTGDPADISAVAASGAVLRESGSVLGFGTVATAGIADDAVTDGKLRNSAALSVIGRSANSSGDPADIAAANDAEVLRRSGTTLGFGTLATAGLADNAVTDPKLRDSGALSVIGRSANSSGDPADISATAASGAVLRESGSVLGFGTIATAGITDAAVTNAKLANMTAGTVKGRQIDAATGVPVDLSGLEVAELLRYGTTQSATLAATTNDLALNADATVLRLTSTTGAQSLTGITGGVQGRLLFVENISADGNPISLTSLDVGSTAGNRFRTPRNLAVTVGFRDTALLRWETNNNDWRVVAVASSPLTDGDKGDITVATSGTVWTIDAGAVTLAKMANLAAGTVIGRQIDASTGVPVALTGAEQGENLRVNTRQTVSASGTLDITLSDDTTILVLQLTADATLRSISNTATGDGRLIRIEHDSGSAFTLTLGHNLATPTFFPLYNSDEADMQVRRGSTVVYRSRSGFWRPEIPSSRMRVRKNSTGTVFDRGRFNLIEGTGVTLTVADDSASNEVDITITGGVVSDGDKGDVTVSSTGTVWTIDNNTVSDAKLRDSGALSVIGRSANSTGDPADISAVAASDAVLRENGSVLGFGTVQSGGIANLAITDGKIRQSAALSVIGRTFNTLGNVADISATAGTDFVLRESGSTLSFGQIATAGIANDAVTDGKLRNGGALSVIGRSANSTGDVADISGTASSDQVLRVSGTTLGFGTVATAGIADAAVTLAKMANLAQSRIIGRAEGAGTGVPTALTPTEVASIIDGETVTWTGSHTFNGTNNTFGGTNLTASVSNNITLGAGATTTISGGTVVQITSPTRLASSITHDSVLTSAATAANDLAIGSVSAVRFTGPVSPLTGMVPVAGAGMVVMLINAHASSDVVVQLNSPSSTAANTFAGSGTDRHIKPGEMALAWYDTTSSQWRLLVRDEVDL